MKEKHIPYFRVFDALKAEGCPLCFLIKDGVEKYFDDLLYEKVNDMDFTSRFRETKGFCSEHSYKFLRYGDSLAVSKTHKLLLADALEGLKNSKPSKKNKNECIICDYIEEMDKRYLSVVKEYLNDREFKEGFLKSDGLCIPHYKKLVSKLKPIPEWLLDFHLAQYENKLKMLNAFLDNSETTMEKKNGIELDDDIWKKVVEVLKGYEGMEK
jgi:hypothetical protein